MLCTAYSKNLTNSNKKCTLRKSPMGGSFGDSDHMVKYLCVRTHTDIWNSWLSLSRTGQSAEANRWWHMGSLTGQPWLHLSASSRNTDWDSDWAGAQVSSVCVCVCVCMCVCLCLCDYMALKVPSCPNRRWSHKEVFSEAAHSKLLSH